MKLRAFLVAIAWLLAGGRAIAANGSIKAVSEQIQASLRVTGSIGIDATGAVTAHDIDHRDRIHPGWRGLKLLRPLDEG